MSWSFGKILRGGKTINLQIQHDSSVDYQTKGERFINLSAVCSNLVSRSEFGCQNRAQEVEEEEFRSEATSTENRRKV